MAEPNRSGSAALGRPPRVSVVLPVHKSEAYVGAAVESILAQSFGDWELLAADDGLSHATSAILQSFAARDARVKVVLAAGAPFVAKLSRGVALSQAGLVARMDADDIAHPDRFARQVAFLDAHPEVAVVGSAVALIDAHGHALRDVQYPESPAAVAALLATGSALAHPSVMMRRAAVLAVGSYRSAYEYAEDYDLWLRIAERYKLANLPERLLLYRQHADKLSNAFAGQQALATRVAQFAAQRRRRGSPDPTDGLTTLSPRDLGRFAPSPEERSAAALDVADAYLAEHARTGSAASLQNTLECLEQVGSGATAPAHQVRTTALAAWHSVRSGRLPAAVKLAVRALSVRGASAAIAVLVRNRFTRLARSLHPTAGGTGSMPR
jgi:hypothetical protein